ncbi:MAG: MAC/perforin domain-containing protein [Bacteroidia bacterium]|nr:MAC/perforin domain-containing protein [Bacteroidia bacterium]
MSNTDSTNNSTSDSSVVRYWIPGLDVLGKGYDVFGRYAHPSAVYNAQIFSNFTQLAGTPYPAEVSGNNYDVPEQIMILEEHTSEESYTEGASISEFQSALDLKVKMEGKYKYYSGEAKFGFHQSKQVSKEYYYTSFSALARAYRLSLPVNSELRSMLDPDFAHELNKGGNDAVSIDAFFAKYGTHFLAEVVLGGKNTYYATVDKSSINSSLSVEASVKASYNNIVSSAKVSVDSSYYSDSSVASTHSETGIETIGGDETKAPLMLTDTDAYEEWLETIADDPALVDFTKNSLRTVWDLIDLSQDDAEGTLAERKAKLEQRFNEISGKSNATLTRGTVKHGEAIYPPFGELENWNLFISPAIIGMSEGSNESDADNALLEFDYGVDRSYPDHWQVKAKYRYRTAKGDKNKIKWYYDGVANYILVPKSIYEHLSLTYNTYDSASGILSWTETTEDDETIITDKYQFSEDNHTITGIENEEEFYENVYLSGDVFYQYKKVSQLVEVEQDESPYLNPPDTLNEWNRIFAPVKFRFTEGGDKDEDNALIKWDFYEFTIPGSLQIFQQVNSNCTYRRSNSADKVETKKVAYQILWVLADYSYWTGAYGNQDLQLPPSDQKIDDWELIVSPISMGNQDEKEDDELKNSSLLQTQCVITQGESYWNVDGSYLWVDKQGDASTISRESSQMECMFIHSSILENIELPEEIVVAQEEVESETEEAVVA